MPVRHGVVRGTVRQFRAVVQPFRFFVQAAGVMLRRPWYGCASAATRACHGRDTICTTAAARSSEACNPAGLRRQIADRYAAVLSAVARDAHRPLIF